MDTSPLEWIEEHEGENRTDPAVALVNMTPEQEIKAVEVTR